MGKFKFSVVIPTYNSEKFIVRTINQVINQTIGFENIELIIVDDNSIDNTPDIISEYSKNHKNIKTIFLQKSHGNPGFSRNMGIEHSTADYILFLDHDDLLHDDLCETIESNITKDMDVIIFGYEMDYDGYVEKFFMNINTINASTILCWNKAYKREFLLNNNIKFPNHLVEDFYFMIQINLKVKNWIALDNYIGYTWVVNPESIGRSGKYKMEVIEGWVECYNLLKKENNLNLYPKKTFMTIYINYLGLNLKDSKQIYPKLSSFFINYFHDYNYNYIFYLFFIWFKTYRSSLLIKYIYKLLFIPINQISIKNRDKIVRWIGF